MRFSKINPFPAIAVTTAFAVVLVLGGCASGPSDFLHMSSNKPEENKVLVRDQNQQAALAAALAAQSRGVSVPAQDPTSLMALSAVRQQQYEEARALVQETETAFKPAEPPLCDPYSVDPSAACPAKTP